MVGEVNYIPSTLCKQGVHNLKYAQQQKLAATRAEHGTEHRKGP